jgi:adenylosuccinate lyase
MSTAASAETSIARLFSGDFTQLLRMQVEVALARAQARRGIIPAAAAEEIARTANLDSVTPDAVATEHRRAGHPMVALLDAWAKVAKDGAGEWIHFGATSADIFDTVLVLQMRRAAQLVLAELRRAEAALLGHAEAHRATPMVGRTAGRHALPITFGLKVASWLGENRRNIERLKAWRVRSDTGMLSGAVGSYASLGPDALAVEADVMAALGLGPPWPADWKGNRDIHAEYGQVLALIARSWANVAQDVFIRQGDDFRELEEAKMPVGSSTMPHKQNPVKSRDILAQARVVVHQADILRDWMVSMFERDQISSLEAVGPLSVAAGRLVRDAADMAEVLVVRPENMRRNLDRTGGLLMAEQAMFLLSTRIGKHTAHEEVRLAAQAAWANGTTLTDELARRPGLSEHVAALDLAHALDPARYVGLAPEATDRTVAAIRAARETDAAELGE